MTTVPLWKLWREIRRLGRQIKVAAPQATRYLLATPYYDLVLARKKRVFSGELSLGAKVAIVLIYPDHGLQPSHGRLLKYFVDRGFSPVVVSNLRLSDADRAKLLFQCASYIERPNFGYDFGGYRDGVLSLGASLRKMERLVLVNDSSWFPLPGCTDWLAEAETLGVDFAGAVSHYGAPRPDRPDYRGMIWDYGCDHYHFHYGSFALLIGPNIMKSRRFLRFWKTMRLTNDKNLVVRRGERGLTRWVIDNGFTHDETYSIRDLDRQLEALGDDALSDVARNITLPHDHEMRGVKEQALAEGSLSRDELIALILTSVARQGPSYSLTDYAIRRHGFPFLKKAMVRLDRTSSDVALRIAASLPGVEGKEILAEALALRARTKLGPAPDDVVSPVEPTVPQRAAVAKAS